MRSHPPTLLRTVERTLKEECGVRAGDSILLAVSGGPDSMALLHACSILAPRLGFELEAAGIDHGLRAAAPEELALARTFCTQLEVPFFASAVSVLSGGNLQARARAARYAELERIQCERGLAFLATAHHADDRAETILLRLLRGAGPEGLCVLEPRSEHLLRPQIRVRKAQVMEHVGRHQIPHALDPSNKDPRFRRTRVREELLPLMAQLDPGIVDHLNHLADELTQGPLPEITTTSGEVVRLGRAHRQQVRRALRHQTPTTRVLLPEDRVLVIDPQTGQPRVETSRTTSEIEEFGRLSSSKGLDAPPKSSKSH